jgi:hypothetical protein
VIEPSDLETIASTLGPVFQVRVDELQAQIDGLMEYANQLAQTIVQMQTQATDGLWSVGVQDAYRAFITLEAARMKVRPAEVLAMKKAMAEGEVDHGEDPGIAG